MRTFDFLLTSLLIRLLTCSKIIRPETALVKTLHPIGDISCRISQAPGQRIELVRDSESIPTIVAVDPVEATKQALAAPLEFPPLASSVVPGDRVAIAVDGAVPCAPGVVRGVVEALSATGVELEAISVVTADDVTSLRCRAEFAERDANAPQFVVHDPEGANNLCLVGLRKNEGPLFVNRTIYDADVVLPIGCARLEGYGVFEGLYPQFSNSEAKEPFLSTTGGG
jgi:predicted amino acid-binding ACT domain protein